MEKKTEIHPWSPALNLYGVLNILGLHMMFEATDYYKMKLLPDQSLAVLQFSEEFLFLMNVCDCVIYFGIYH